MQTIKSKTLKSGIEIHIMKSEKPQIFAGGKKFWIVAGKASSRNAWNKSNDLKYILDKFNKIK